MSSTPSDSELERYNTYALAVLDYVIALVDLGNKVVRDDVHTTIGTLSGNISNRVSGALSNIHSAVTGGSFFPEMLTNFQSTAEKILLKSASALEIKYIKNPRLRPLEPEQKASIGETVALLREIVEKYISGSEIHPRIDAFTGSEHTRINALLAGQQQHPGRN